MPPEIELLELLELLTTSVAVAVWLRLPLVPVIVKG